MVRVATLHSPPGWYNTYWCTTRKFINNTFESKAFKLATFFSSSSQQVQCSTVGSFTTHSFCTSESTWNPVSSIPTLSSHHSCHQNLLLESKSISCCCTMYIPCSTHNKSQATWLIQAIILVLLKVYTHTTGQLLVSCFRKRAVAVCRVTTLDFFAGGWSPMSWLFLLSMAAVERALGTGRKQKIVGTVLVHRFLLPSALVRSKASSKFA